MRKVHDAGGVPVKMWLDDLEPGALEQAENLSRLPFAFRHVAVMPDAHRGYGMPIGGVMASEGAVVPNAVGVDIGCGMAAVRSTLPVSEVDADGLRDVMGDVRRAVPVGFAHHASPRAMPQSLTPETEVVSREFDSASRQIGTLGGGNHFIELQAGDDGFVWLMVHSGSRNVGKRVADRYNGLAVELNGRWRSSVPKEHGLAFLPLDSAEADAYLAEMGWCVRFAEESRAEMVRQCCLALSTRYPTASFGDVLDVPHNYADFERHFGRDVLVHRKGATRAYEGEAGIIPGSQGTSSFVVEGRGNRESFMSCSHGAGRRLGRAQAKRELTVEGQAAKLDALGVVHGIRSVSDLDEAPDAYKDIDEVMANQEDLVEVKVRLRPLAVVKG